MTPALLAPGVYELLVYPHSTVLGGFGPATTLIVYVDMPAQTLSVTLAGAGTGTVTSSPSGITCGTGGGSCSTGFAYETDVTLTATPDGDMRFAGWSGACTSTSPVCVVDMTTARAVTATFLPPPPIVTTIYHVDALGSVRVITDMSAAVVERHDYFPFGEDLTPAGGDPVGFTGKERDPETNFEYFGARYYRNSVGRFTSVDPAMEIVENAFDPQGWNRYSYVRNRPTAYVDPDGRNPALVGAFFGPAGLAAAAAATVGVVVYRERDSIAATVTSATDSIASGLRWFASQIALSERMDELRTKLGRLRDISDSEHREGARRHAGIEVSSTASSVSSSDAI